MVASAAAGGQRSGCPSPLYNLCCITSRKDKIKRKQLERVFFQAGVQKGRSNGNDFYSFYLSTGAIGQLIQATRNHSDENVLFKTLWNIISPLTKLVWYPFRPSKVCSSTESVSHVSNRLTRRLEPSAGRR